VDGKEEKENKKKKNGLFVHANDAYVLRFVCLCFVFTDFHTTKHSETVTDPSALTANYLFP